MARIHKEPTRPSHLLDSHKFDLKHLFFSTDSCEEVQNISQPSILIYYIISTKEAYLMTVRVEYLSHYHPEGIITNKKFEQALDTTNEWIVNNVGIKQRRFMNDYTGSMPVYEIAKRAFLKLISEYKFDLKSIDLIISCSTHDDLHYPNPANMISEEFDLEVPAMQIKTACTSVVYGIHTAKAYIEAGLANRVLILNGEPFTRFVDYGDRSSCILFGDAATALVISREPGVFEVVDSEIGGLGLRLVEASRVTDTSHFSPSEFVSGHLSPSTPVINRRRNSDRKFQQDGREVMNFVLTKIPKKLHEFMAKRNIKGSEINYFISHQSNLKMMTNLFDSLNLQKARHLHNIELFGNVSSAGWVTVISSNRNIIMPNELALISTFGAGMTWGNLLLKKC